MKKLGGYMANFMKMLHKKNVILFLSLAIILLLSGCAEVVEVEFTENVKTYGFFYGLWHGLIAPISFIISLFSNNVAMYAVNNNGGWYNFGFLLGASVSIGGSCKASKRKK